MYKAMHEKAAIPPSAASGDLLTADEVIDRLSDEPRLRKVALTCVLRAVKVGSEWRFRRIDLDHWIERQMES